MLLSKKKTELFYNSGIVYIYLICFALTINKIIIIIIMLYYCIEMYVIQLLLYVSVNKMLPL